MDKRTAKRIAHWWVAAIIDGALANGAEDPTFIVGETDRERLLAAVEEIRDSHDRAGAKPAPAEPNPSPEDRWI